ncbi:hypothetical protein C6497_06820 [Candidatus Poribacteria bacterium]|nr:MAG: hypothetical protein C6497_06820 [Candidatus Poribacteria bacterium]
MKKLKYINPLTILGFGCTLGILFVLGVKLQAKNTMVETSNKAKVIATKPMLTANTIQIKNTRFSPKKHPQSNYKNKNSNDNSDFYQVIIDNSLFRPLGWKPPNKEPEYTLLGTIIDPLGIHSKAYVLERRSDAFHTVRIGENVGDMVIEEIEDKKVTLDKNGETITLRTADIQFLKTGGSSSPRQDRSVQNENTKNNNDKSSEATKRSGYRNISRTNKVNQVNQKNLKAIIKNAGKGSISFDKGGQKIILDKKLIDMALKNSKGKVTVELKEK